MAAASCADNFTSSHPLEIHKRNLMIKLKPFHDQLCQDPNWCERNHALSDNLGYHSDGSGEMIRRLVSGMAWTLRSFDDELIESGLPETVSGLADTLREKLQCLVRRVFHPSDPDDRVQTAPILYHPDASVRETRCSSVSPSLSSLGAELTSPPTSLRVAADLYTTCSRHLLTRISSCKSESVASLEQNQCPGVRYVPSAVLYEALLEY